MTQSYEYIGLIIVTVWVAFRVISLIRPGFLALWSSLALVCAAFIIASESLFLIVAVLAPFGAMLPALALQNIVGRLQDRAHRVFPTSELAIVLIVYVAFLSASMGVFEFDPYRYGYFPLFGSAAAFVICGYALWRGYHYVAIASVVGQIAWIFDVGSSNYFDHITHVMVIFVIATVLAKRLWNRRFSP